MARTFLFSSRRRAQVSGVGPLASPIVFLGEALGRDETFQREPFVGAAGQFMFHGRDWSGQTKFPGLEELGLPRSDVRIENVIEIRPRENSLLNLTPDAVRKWQASWWERASRLTGANVIVPLGNLALNTLRRNPLPLTQRGTWRVHSGPDGRTIDWKDKITNWRGSVFHVEMPNGGKLKCIPTLHPAYVMRGGSFYDPWLGDWDRILADRAFPELRLDPVCEHLIDPTQADGEAFYHDVERAWDRDGFDACLASDIETVGRKYIDLIGFSLDKKFSITFNMRQSWAWRLVARLYQLPIPKGWHYGIFDTYVLRRLKGLRIARALHWDSQLQHHCLDPRDQHRLGYCGSRDLRVQFWKTERDKEDESSLAVKNPKRRARYNGKDVSYTRALIERYRARLAEAGLTQFYRDHYRTLAGACLQLSLTGFKVDHRARREMLLRETAKVTDLRKRLDAATGTSLLAKGGGFSPPKVNAYFYDTLKCKPFYKRGTHNRTTDELAIRRLMRKYKKARPVGLDILAYRQHKKIAQELRSTIVDEDGRMRSRFTPTAKTGRLRAAKTPTGSGVNLQNRDRHSDLRRMFVADPGHVLIEFDESQAEDRMVDGMSGDPRALKDVGSIAIDRHIRHATFVYDDAEYEPLLRAYLRGDPEAKNKRQMGKRYRHARNYGMGGKMMADTVLLETGGALVLDPSECEENLERMDRRAPWIRTYQDWIEEAIVNDGYLEDSWGWRIWFKNLRLSREDHKEGFAWRASDEVAKIMNRLGLCVAYLRIRSGEWAGAKIVHQGHDSVALSVPPELAWPVASTLYHSLNQERTYPGAGGPWKLKMPVGTKIGRVWKGMHEFTVLPSREEFQRTVEEVMR